MQPANTPPTPWQLWNAFSQHIHKVQCQLDEQQAVINRLSKQLEALNARLDAAESKPSYHIDTIQYHFDQLKVEKLDGTLNIGLTPPNEEQFKEIGQIVMPSGNSTVVVNDPGSKTATDNPPVNNLKPNVFPVQPGSIGPGPVPGPGSVLPSSPYPEIRLVIDRYLDQNAPQQLSELEAELSLSLDPYHRRLIIEDIRKQMSARIQFYIQAAEHEAKSSSSSPEGSHAPSDAQIQEAIIGKTTRDIHAALRSYLSRLQN
ncbi:spore germination protein GerPC [Paenibacillus sp. CF384]|uniref:spore germination protein GerPC n=1 Tax=Paenibacillus sp. CF384 TaxID=1884382 RepID=UPI00089C693A|nr:spore germination protein GerPC [Paenibacillus sp. CF384]SDW58139.1 spore germination protein PC [Paenibacillus sp. CF384]